jgi:CheY-like chemotaxis protein
MPVVSQELRILVVEDNETNLRVIDSMLGRLGYRATNVENGRAAVDLVKQQRFDIIFMDCQMPVMDGYQATAEIREAESAGEHAIIIAMTGNAMEGDRERCLMAGMDDYIPKPVRLTILAEALSKWVGKINKA